MEGEGRCYPLPVTDTKTERSSQCMVRRFRSCQHVRAMDLGILLSSIPGATLAGHMAAFHHSNLREARPPFSLYAAVAAGTYRETNVYMLLLPPIVSLLPPSHFQLSLPSMDWEQLDIRPGVLLPIMKIGEVLGFERVLGQPW